MCGRHFLQSALLGYLYVATVEFVRGVADERSETRKLLKIARGGTIIRLLEGASLRSPRQDCRRPPVAALMTATGQLGHGSRPDLIRLLRLSPFRMQALLLLQLGTPAAASAVSAS